MARLSAAPPDHTAGMNPRDVLRYCPRCGADAFRSENGHRFGCSACDFVFFLNNAAGVGVIVEHGDGRILVVERARDPGKGLLDWPGGFVDPGEGFEDCLHRELREELGAEVASYRYLCSHANTYTYRDLTYRVADAFYVARVANIDALSAQDDVAGFKLVDPGDLDPDRFAFVSARYALTRYRESLPK
jgi:ADP-ribose pyrophosphatase YjhB (NUDIX family)